ncbi:MAG: NifU family protein [Flavobacteriales bacterium]
MATKRIPISIYAEITPNPSVMKFVSNIELNPNDSLEFKNIEDAQVSPLCTKLFTLPFVKEVFLAKNFIAITKFNIVEWDTVAMEVRVMIQEYIADGGIVLKENITPDDLPQNNIEPEETAIDKIPENEIEERIIAILNEYVKPSVAQDGGDIIFSDYEDGVLKVKLLGACNGCPSASVTLKQGVQNIFQQMMPNEVHTVEEV